MVLVTLGGFELIAEYGDGPQSGVKDEIDFEWTTNNTNEVFSNYFWCVAPARSASPSCLRVNELTRCTCREGDVDDYTHGGEHTARNNNQQFIT